MVFTVEQPTGVWTAVDLVKRLGAIPLERVHTNPPPGSATERDVIEIHDRENRLCELLDGTLLEKNGGDVLPGLQLPLKTFFARPGEAARGIGFSGFITDFVSGHGFCEKVVLRQGGESVMNGAWRDGSQKMKYIG